MDVLRELVLPLSLASNLTQWCCSGKRPENIQHITSAVFKHILYCAKSEDALNAMNSFYESINFIQKTGTSSPQCTRQFVCSAVILGVFSYLLLSLHLIPN